MTKTTADDQARLLFEGVVPELTTDLAEMWAKYSPTFSVLAEDGDDGPLVMQAGAYRHVQFNHRMMRAFWLGSYVAKPTPRHKRHSMKTASTRMRLTARD